MRETWVQSLGWEDPLEEGTTTHSSIQPGESPWTEEPGGLQSMGSQRVRHDWATKQHSHVNVDLSVSFLHCYAGLIYPFPCYTIRVLLEVLIVNIASPPIYSSSSRIAWLFFEFFVSPIDFRVSLLNQKKKKKKWKERRQEGNERNLLGFLLKIWLDL